MKDYNLSLLFFGAPVSEAFSAPDDQDATWFARGFIAGFIGRSEEDYIGSQWRLDADLGRGAFDETTLVGECVVEKRDGTVGQQWQVVRRRWLRNGTDMNVGDPHDDPEPRQPSDAAGRVRKRASKR